MCANTWGSLMLRGTLFFLCLCAGLMGFEARAADAVVPDFRLLDTRGASHALGRQSDAQAIVLVAWDAKHADAAAQSITAAELARDFAKAGVRFFVIDPAARGDVVADAARIAPAPTQNDALLKGAAALLGNLGVKAGTEATLSDTVPVLRDPVQAVTRAVGFRGVFDAVLLNAKDRTVLYRGTLGPGLREALTALAGGSLSAPLPSAEAPATPLALATVNTTPSYANEVGPILKEKCAVCHHGGGTAPFAFDAHAKIAKYADMIHEVLLTQQMPPWHADPAVGHFRNNRALSDTQLKTVLAWVEAGAPRGEGDDPLLAVGATQENGWPLGEPDVVLSMSEPYQLPAEGILEYHVIKVPSNFTEDTWIRGVSVKPGNPKVVHHALIFIEYPPELKAREPRVNGGAAGYFAGFVPGAEPYFYPEGSAKYAPPGATFIFQIHYVTTGKPETDVTQLGLYLAKERPARRVETEAASNMTFQIPPQVRDFPVNASDRLGLDAELIGLSPHMHYRGSRFKYKAVLPDGTEEVLLSVPNFNFDWQTMYQFNERKSFPRGTRMICEGGFDNSVSNPANPDPNDTVRFGDQTFQEMFIGYYEYSAPVEAFEKRFERIDRYMQEERARFEAENPGILTAPPLTMNDLIGTTWEGDEFTFTFKANDEILVSSIIKGTWKVVDKKVVIDVVGEHFELDIIGQGLFFNGTYPITRLK